MLDLFEYNTTPTAVARLLLIIVVSHPILDIFQRELHQKMQNSMPYINITLDCSHFLTQQSNGEKVKPANLGILAS